MLDLLSQLKIKIPFELPFDVPVGLHSPVVHFAIAIPVIIVLLEFFNIFFRKKSLSVFSLFLTLLLATVMVGAYYTGVSDGQEAYDFLINEGKEELKEHKELGILLVYASLALVVLKLFFMLFKGAVARILFLFILIAFTGAVLKQGHDGGELVYEYGANNKALQKALEKNDDLKDELEELKEECETKKDSAKEEEEKKEEPKAQEAKEEPKAETSVAQDSKEETKEKEEEKADSNKEEKEESKDTDSNSSASSDSNNS